MKKNIHDLDYFQWMLLDRKPAKIFRRGDEAFFYHENVRYDLSEGILGKVDGDEVDLKMVDEKIETGIPDQTTVDGKIFIERSSVSESIYMVYWSAYNQEQNKLPVLILTMGRMYEKED